MLHFFISCLLLSPLRRISFSFFFFFNDPAPPDIYPLPLPDALPIYVHRDVVAGAPEDRVRLDVHPHVQVARRSAALTRCALAPEPDPLPVRHARGDAGLDRPDRKSTRLNSSHGYISYAVFCLNKKKQNPCAKPIDSTSFLMAPRIRQ